MKSLQNKSKVPSSFIFSLHGLHVALLLLAVKAADYDLWELGAGSYFVLGMFFNPVFDYFANKLIDIFYGTKK